jgi:hypothetical protein
MADCEHCSALRAENASLTIDLQHAYGEVAFQTDKVTIHGEAVTRLTARVEELEGALGGVLWMAYEWFNHGGDETTFADDYEARLETARAALEGSA